MVNREKDKLPTNEETADSGNIGSLLKRARMDLNEDLSRVSSNLRIRQVYLEAIENNQFSVLPGDIYVIGFIRSYSEYLNLDTEEIVNQYKNEVNQGTKKTDLIFPAFVPEHGIPGGAILLVGLIVAIVGYSSWYVITNQNRFSIQQVTNIPSKLPSSDKKTVTISEIPNKGTPSPGTMVKKDIVKQFGTTKKEKTKKRNQVIPKVQKPEKEEKTAQNEGTPTSTATQGLEPKTEKEEKTAQNEETTASTATQQ